MLLNECMIDWLTLTQWSEDGTWLYDVARAYVGDTAVVQDAKVMQYLGWSSSSVFFGSATQAGRVHNMVRVSGSAAADFLYRCGTPPASVRCTRIDVQVTVPLDSGYDVVSMADRMRSGAWKGRKRAVTYISGKDGLDTVYVGSRQSELFVRLYIKECSLPVSRAIRFEVELKAGKADTFFRRWLSETIEMDGFLLYEWGKFPERAREMLPSIGSVLAGGEAQKLAGVSRVVESSGTMKWFIRSVVPAVRRLLNSHEYGEATRRYLVGLLSEGDGGLTDGV